MTALHTWGLYFRGTSDVAMFNMSKAEALKIEELSGGDLICRPVCTTKHYPSRRKLPGSKVHAA